MQGGEHHYLAVAVLAEIRSLLIAKWGFEQVALEDYHRVIISRFENPYIVDDIVRVARTPIRKLGYDERFIRPIRELAERKLSYQHLLETVAAVFAYRDPSDPQAVELQELLASQPLKEVVVQVTGLEEGPLLEAVVAQLED